MTPTAQTATLERFDQELARLRALDAEAFDAVGPRDLEIWTTVKVVPGLQKSASISVGV